MRKILLYARRSSGVAWQANSHPKLANLWCTTLFLSYYTLYCWVCHFRCARVFVCVCVRFRTMIWASCSKRWKFATMSWRKSKKMELTRLIHCALLARMLWRMFWVSELAWRLSISLSKRYCSDFWYISIDLILCCLRVKIDDHTEKPPREAQTKMLHSRSCGIVLCQQNTFLCNKVTPKYVLWSIWSLAHTGETLKLWNVSQVRIDHCSNLNKTLMQENVFSETNKCQNHKFKHFYLVLAWRFIGVNEGVLQHRQLVPG